jgi:hypothetical protein
LSSNVSAILLERMERFERSGGSLWLDCGQVRFQYPADAWPHLGSTLQTLRRYRHEVSRLMAARPAALDPDACFNCKGVGASRCATCRGTGRFVAAGMVQ